MAKDRLILLYDSLCLRRTKDILTLPGHTERTRELHLTPNEKQQYDRTMRILNRYMRTQVGYHAGGAGYGHHHSYQSWKSTKFGLFQAHMQLRILCNHGTFQKPFSWKKRDLKDEKTAEREAFLSEMGLGSELLCDGCKQLRPVLGSTASAQNNFVEDCAHSFCLECLEDFRELPGIQNSRRCPLCELYKKSLAPAQSAQAPPNTPPAADGGGGSEDVVMEEAAGDDGDVNEQNSRHRDYFNDLGYSTKMAALLEDVKQDMAGTKR